MKHDRMTDDELERARENREIAEQVAHDRPSELVQGDTVITTTHFDESRAGARVVPEGAGADTTHSGYGAGSPRFVAAGHHTDATGAVTVPGRLLTGETTVIGSGVDAHLRLEGLEAAHAVVHHTDDDEFVLLLRGPAETSGAPNTEYDGEPAHLLRTGFELRIGEHSLVYQRDEHADHGRPHGGREGGEFSHQPQQPDRPTGQPPLPESYDERVEQ